MCAITFVRDGQTESYGPVVRVHSEYPVIGGLQHTLSRNCGRLHGHPLNLVSATVGRFKVYAFQNNPILRVLPPSYWRYRALSGLATLLTCAFCTLCLRLVSPEDSVLGLFPALNSSLAYFSSRRGSSGMHDPRQWGRSRSTPSEITPSSEFSNHLTGAAALSRGSPPF